jgi:hypothetical protein
MNLRQKKELIKYIDFHSRAGSSNINTIQAIVSSENLKSELAETFNLLKKDWVTVTYSKGMKPGKFIEDLLWPLYQGKTILVETDTLDFDPIVYNQLMELREKNKFTLGFAQGVPISPTASVFLSYCGKGDDKKLEEVVDHILKVAEIN